MASVAAAGISTISPSASLASTRLRKLSAASQRLRGGGSKVSVYVPGSALGWEKRRRSVCVCSFKTTRGDPKSDAAGITLDGIDFYELLGISQQVTSLHDIKFAYRGKARRYHPDANPPEMKDECTKKFLQVQEAYEVLTDVDRRADYDYRLAHPNSFLALQGFSFMRKGQHKGGSAKGKDVTVDKSIWRSQCDSQLHGLKRDTSRQKKGSWADQLKKRRQEAVHQAA